MIQSIVPSGGGSIPAGTLNGNAVSVNILNGVSSIAVVFPDAMPDTNYALVASIRNTVDGSPIFLQIVETAKATTGFTATFNAPTDSANYRLEYIAAREL